MSKGKIDSFLVKISRTKAQFRIGTDKVYDGTYKLSSKGKRKIKEKFVGFGTREMHARYRVASFTFHHTCAAALVIIFGTYSSSVTQKTSSYALERRTIIMLVWANHSISTISQRQIAEQAIEFPSIQ